VRQRVRRPARSKQDATRQLVRRGGFEQLQRKLRLGARVGA
jgi:hypothetical protein